MAAAADADDWLSYVAARDANDVDDVLLAVAAPDWVVVAVAFAAAAAVADDGILPESCKSNHLADRWCYQSVTSNQLFHCIK